MNKNDYNKTLIFVSSYHHYNSLKIAEAFASVLHAHIKTPEDPENIHLDDYDLVWFGN